MHPSIPTSEPVQPASAARMLAVRPVKTARFRCATEAAVRRWSSKSDVGEGCSCASAVLYMLQGSILQSQALPEVIVSCQQTVVRSEQCWSALQAIQTMSPAVELHGGHGNMGRKVSSKSEARNDLGRRPREAETAETRRRRDELPRGPSPPTKTHKQAAKGSRPQTTALENTC